MGPLSLFAARAFSLPLLSTLTPHFLFCFSDGDFRHHPTASAGHTWPMCDSLIPILIPGRFFFSLSKSRSRFILMSPRSCQRDDERAICNLDLFFKFQVRTRDNQLIVCVDRTGFQSVKTHWIRLYLYFFK